MKIPLSAEIKNITGKTMRIDQPDGTLKNATLKDILLNSCVAALPGDHNLKAMEKYAIGCLIQRIIDAKSEIDLPLEEIVKLKDRVGQAVQNCYVIKQVLDILDKKE